MLGEFLLDPAYINLNHGSFGTVARSVLEAQQGYVLQQEARPDPWFRDTYLTLLAQTRDLLAQECGLPDSSGLVLLENASAAVNSIFRSMKLSEGDIFVYFSTAYGMVKHTAAWLEESAGIRIVEVPLALPIKSNDCFISPLKEALESLTEEEKGRVKLATFSHVSSVPAFIEPISDLATLVKSFSPDAKVLVDGAHALGQIPLSIPSLGPIDYYLSNAHKWMYAPKGSAFLWTDPSCIDDLRPQPTVISSHNDVSGGTEYSERYGYTGTKDFTAYLSIADAIAFRKSLEESNGSVIEYTHGLGRWAGDYLTDKFNTMRLSPPEFEANLINIVLPTDDFELASKMQQDLYDDHGVYMLALKDEPTGLVFTRLSTQIYLDKSDFVRVGDLIQEYLKTAETVKA